MGVCVGWSWKKSGLVVMQLEAGRLGMTLPRNIRRSSELWMEAQGSGHSLAGKICMYICRKEFRTGLIGEYSHELTRCSADKSGMRWKIWR